MECGDLILQAGGKIVTGRASGNLVHEPHALCLTVEAGGHPCALGLSFPLFCEGDVPPAPDGILNRHENSFFPTWHDDDSHSRVHLSPPSLPVRGVESYGQFVQPVLQQ